MKLITDNQPVNCSIVYWIHRPCQKNIWSEGYVGITKLPAKQRLLYHLRDANRHNTPLANAIKKYKDLIFEIILIADTRDYCGDIEAKIRPSMNIGWNIAKGGNTLMSDAGTEASKKTYQQRRLASACKYWWESEIKLLRQMHRQIKKEKKIIEKINNPPHSKERKVSKQSSSGYTGVSWYEPYQKWRVQIGMNGTAVYLGYFDDLQSGYEVYLKAKQAKKSGKLALFNMK